MRSVKKKICNVCKEIKDISTFSKNIRKKDGLQTLCKACRKIWAANYYQTSPKEKLRVIEKARFNRANLKKIIREKKSVPCTDCKNSYPYYVMDFDHQYDKKFTIARAVSENQNINLILSEIEKCEVVCSNCHRIRTHKHLDDIVI